MIRDLQGVRPPPCHLTRYSPQRWQWISPDEIADNSPYSIGIGPFGSNLLRSDYREHGVRLIFVRDIVRAQFNETGARYVTREKAADLHQHVVEGGDVLITKMGDPPGDTALYPIGSTPAVITSDCMKFASPSTTWPLQSISFIASDQSLFAPKS